MHINSVVSTPEAKYLCTDVHNSYLNAVTEDPKYTRIIIKLFPVEIMDQYGLWDKVNDGHIYMKISKGMYNLPQAGILSNKQLVIGLKPYSYEPCKFTQRLWIQKTNGITITICVDDFGIKYTDPVIHSTSLMR